MTTTRLQSARRRPTNLPIAKLMRERVHAVGVIHPLMEALRGGGQSTNHVESIRGCPSRTHCQSIPALVGTPRRASE